MSTPSTRATKAKLYPDFGIDEPLDEFLGSQVPSHRDAIRHFFYHNREIQMSIDKSYRETAGSLLRRWMGSAVPLSHPNSIKDIVKVLHCELK